MTHEKILAMLAGKDSQSPMPFDDLVKASGLMPATLETVLAQMVGTYPPLICSASITKGGSTNLVYWPTGVIAKAVRQHITINMQKSVQNGFSGSHPPFRTEVASRIKSGGSNGSENKITSIEVKESASKVQQTAVHESKQTQERAMSAKGTFLRDVVYRLISENPGIQQGRLLEQALLKAPMHTEKQVLKTLSNLTQYSRITSVGRSASRIFMVTSINKLEFHDHEPSAPTTTTPAVAKVAAPLIAAPAAADPETKKPAPTPPFTNEYLSIMLSDDNYLHLGFGDEHFMLDPDQLRRLAQFMARVFPDGAPA